MTIPDQLQQSIKPAVTHIDVPAIQEFSKMECPVFPGNDAAHHEHPCGADVKWRKEFHKVD
jgi:hypothetical protein